MDDFSDRLNNKKESILKYVSAKYIYLFGSYAYGSPTEKSDIDIYIVTPDGIENFSEIYAKIIGDLSEKKIFFIDLLLNVESDFLNKFANDFPIRTDMKQKKMTQIFVLMPLKKLKNLRDIKDV
jgi:predicted nucleotidyltransferase